MPVALTIEPQFLAKMRKGAAKFPTAFSKAQKYAVSIAKRQFSSIMRSGGGKYGVEKFKQNPVTTAVKKAQGVQSFKADWYRKDAQGNTELVKGEAYKSAKLFDGIQVRFATDTTYHVAFLSGGAWHIGFPAKVDAFLGPLLEAKNEEFTPETHWRLEHDTGKKVPQMYERPRRLIIEPWAKRLAEGEFVRWLLGALGKSVRRNCGLQLMYGALSGK